jgi:nucleoid-associated protein YgaU
MNRYTSTENNTFARYDGKRVLKTTRYPRIPYESTDVYIIVNEGDYLDSLAERFYRDTTLWWIIAQANGIKATLKAPTGKQIRIPTNVSGILANFKRENLT